MKNKITKTLKKALLKVSGTHQKQAKPYEFISWLKFANAGMLDNGNLYCFEYAIEHLPSNSPVIEIGSFADSLPMLFLLTLFLRKSSLGLTHLSPYYSILNPKSPANPQTLFLT